MSNPFVGEIKLFGGNFPPSGWMFCQGQLLQISEYDTLFALIGTTYGGDGQQTFGLPNLSGRVPVHMGQGPGLQNYVIGGTGGVESVTITGPQLPVHNHTPQVSSVAGTTNVPASNTVLATMGPSGTGTVNTWKPYDGTGQVTLANSISFAGGNQPHDNMQPSLAISYIISLFGIYPSPN